MKLIVTFLFLFAFAARSQTLTYPAQWPYTQPFPTAGSTPGTTIKVPGTINPSGYGDNSSVWDSFIGGGPQRVGTLSERNNIPLKRRGELQTVTVKEDMNTYILLGGIQNTNWVRLGTVTTNGFSSLNIYNSDGYLDNDRLMVGNLHDLTLGQSPSFPLKDFTVNYFGTSTFNGLSTNDVFIVQNPSASFELNGPLFSVINYDTEFDSELFYVSSFLTGIDGDRGAQFGSGGSTAYFNKTNGVVIDVGTGNSGGVFTNFLVLRTANNRNYNSPVGSVLTVISTNTVNGVSGAFVDFEPPSGGGSSTNIGNSDLTVTDALRTLDGGGNAITLTNFANITIASDTLTSIESLTLARLYGASSYLLSSSGSAVLAQAGGTLLARGPGNFVLQTPQVYAGGTNAVVGMALTLLNTNGVADWATITGGTNYFNITNNNTYVADNFANTNLVFTEDRLHDVAGYNLSISNIANIVIGNGGGNTATGGGGDIVAGGNSNQVSGGYSGAFAGEANEVSNYAAAAVGGAGNTASGDSSFVGGGNNSVASGSFSSVIGGDSNSATNIYSGVFTGQNNIAGGENSVVVGGNGNFATGNSSVALGGAANTASGDGSVSIGGYDGPNTASGYGAIVLSAGGGTASGQYSTVIGGYNSSAAGDYTLSFGVGAVSPNVGQVSIASITTVTPGLSQDSTIRIGINSIDDTTTILTPSGSGTNSPFMPTGSVWLVEQTVVGMTESAAKVGTFIRRYTISRPTNEASTVILGSVQVVGVDTGTNAGVPPANWTVTIDANTDEGGPRTTVTGDVGDTVRWHSHLKINQVVYVP